MFDDNRRQAPARVTWQAVERDVRGPPLALPGTHSLPAKFPLPLAGCHPAAPCQGGGATRNEPEAGPARTAAYRAYNLRPKGR
jgi:hypothetical protein